jgi:hypothetical protein
MFWEFFSLSNLVNHAEAMRRRHSLWLTRAMRQPAAYPRIPTRPVGDGGFSPLMSSPAGKAWAEEWWADTLRMQELDL